MTMTTKNDYGVEVLVEVRAQEAPDLDVQVLRRCYEIQVQHQFEQDPNVVLEKMRRLVEDFVRDEEMSTNDPRS
jgi:hypothetical protein